MIALPSFILPHSFSLASFKNLLAKNSKLFFNNAPFPGTKGKAKLPLLICKLHDLICVEVDFIEQFLNPFF